MDLKKEDFILVTVLDGRKVLALRPDYFKDKAPIGEPLMDAVKEVFETKKAKEIEIPEPEPTEEELAEIEKEKRKAELLEELLTLG